MTNICVQSPVNTPVIGAIIIQLMRQQPLLFKSYSCECGGCALEEYSCVAWFDELKALHHFRLEN